MTFFAAPAHARHIHRPSATAGAIVLLALASERPPFVQPGGGNGRRTLILGDALRITQRADGLLAVERRELGHWRPDPESASLTLIDPAQMIDAAVTCAVRECIWSATADGPLESLDRLYVERRLRADLYPGAGNSTTLRSVRSLIFNHLVARRLLRASCLIFGARVRIADLNDVTLAGAGLLDAITRETPNLAPLLGATVRRHARKGAPPAAPGMVGEVRRALRHLPEPHRLARRDWKWLTRQSLLTVRLLAGDGGDGVHGQPDTLAVRLFAAAGEDRVPGAIVGLARTGGPLRRALTALEESCPTGPHKARRDDLSRLVRLAIRETRSRIRRGQSLRFLRDDAGYLIDWWIDESAHGMPLVAPNATWASLIRKQQRWHQLVILKHPEFLQHWPSAVQAHETGGVRVVPLTDSLMLAREGIEMRHCVASYARDCVTGNTRVFALEDRGTGERATAELRRRAWTWFAGQVKGPCNAGASPALHGAADQVAQRYTRAISR